MKRILFIADASAGGGGASAKETAEQTIARLNLRIVELEDEVATLKQAEAEASEFEIAVNARMRPGLSREQAIAAEKRQREFDANKKAAEVEAKKAAGKSAKK